MPVDATAAALSSFKLERDAHSVRVENVPIGGEYMSPDRQTLRD